MTSFTDARHDHAGRLAGLRRIPVALAAPGQEARLRRDIPRFPYVPADPADRDERCAEVYHIQVHGLVQRLRAIGTGKVVIGVSGGLDSAHALTVAAQSMDRLGLPRRNILAYTMPGFATSAATLDHARQLMTALGATPGEIDIRPSARQMLRDIGHPAADGTAVYDVTYENVQAGERNGPPTCSGWPTATRRSSSGPGTSASWRWAGARSGWVTRCRTTTSTRRYPRP